MKSMIPIRNILSMASSMLVLLMPTTLWSLDDDPLASAKRIPPEYLSPDQREISLASIQWQIKQSELLSAHYESSRNSISQSIEELNLKLSNLKESVAPEIRLMDRSVRSQLVGKAMEKLLDSRLELASLEKSIAMLEQELIKKSGSKLNALRQTEFDLEAEVAAKRYSLAKMEYEKMQKLRKANSMSDQQLMRSKFSAEIAQLEFESARTRGVIEREKTKMEAAARLSDQRIEIGPIKSRIEAIEKFLQKFSDANAVSHEIEQTERAIELWEKDLKLVANKMFEIHSSSQHLKSLKTLIEKQATNIPKTGE